MKWKQQKQSVKYFFFSFVLSLSLIFSPISSFGLLATTTSGSENLFEYTENYVRDNFNALCRFVVKQNAIISDAIIGTWDNFVSWLDSSGNGDLWEQHPHSPIRVQNGVENVEVPQDVLNVINQYVIYQIQQNQLGYVGTYIYSYNFLDTSTFGNIAPYNSLKNFIKSQDGYVLVNYGNFKINSSENGYMIYVIPKSLNMGLYGTVTQGSFTNVQMSIDWKSSQYLNQMSSQVKAFYMNESGSITEGITNFNGWVVRSIKNNNSLTFNSTNAQFTMFTNLPKNEYMYVFNTLNAYKNYNAGLPQSYYLTSEGASTSMSNWSVGSGTINTGTLSNVNSTYNNVVNNVQSGWSADQVLELVDKILANSGGSGSGGSGSDDGTNFWDWLVKIGDGFGNFIEALGNAIERIISGITNAIMDIVHLLVGYTDEDGIEHAGILNNMIALINGGFNDFLSGVFSWLPPEIVTAFTALLVIGIFFAIWKIIRG